jgi:xyloglucan-specific exo-beta-1,4-glucanase
MKNCRINLAIKINRIIYTLNILLIIFGIRDNSFGQTYSWGNVAMGGGGFVSGVITHKTSGDIYCRTDVGGAYRWDATNSKWIPLLDWCSDQEISYQGVESLAIDPQNSNNVYMLAATWYWNSGKTAILKSTDKGSTFSATIVTSQFTADGNNSGRSNGERLAVDPNNSNILFCGTRRNGLWKSTNGGTTWSQAWSGVTTTTNDNGICFVVFDPSSVSGGITQTIYIGISRTGSANIYKSTDGGSTFTAISATTTLMPHRAALVGTTLYVTHSDGEGPSNPTQGKVYKLNTSTSAWTDITPNANGLSYGGVSVDPANASRVIVSTINQWGNNQYGTNNAWGDYIYLSTNGGTNWTLQNGSNSTFDNSGSAWMNGQVHWSGSIEFDPLNTAKAWVVSGNGIFSCSNLGAAAPKWKFDVHGLEEIVPQDAVSISGGPFVSVISDYDGFVHSDITAYPANRHLPSMGSTTGIAYAPTSTSILVRVGSSMYYSTNQGSTWTQTTAMNGSQGKVAIAYDASIPKTTILHSPNGSNSTYYSTNNGGTWTSTGLNIASAFPVVDMVNPSKFYVYNNSSGVMYVSTNGGVSFAASGSPGTWGAKRIQTVPGNEGHIWIAMYGGGLKRSINSGAAFTTPNAAVTYCGAVGLGKTEPSATYPTIYIWGTIGGVTGIYRSIDIGANWTRINDDAHEWGGPGNGEFVLGDWNVYGRVYMSTVGRGIVYGDISGPQPLAANAGSDVTICQGNSATLSGSGSGGTSPYTYTWSPTTGLSSSTIYNPVATPTSTTTYTLTVKDAANATATDAVTLTVTPATSIPFAENFNGVTYPPTGWTTSTTGTTGFDQTGTAILECPNPSTSSKGAWVNTNGSSAGTADLITPSLSFANSTNTQLSFDYAWKGDDVSGPNDKFDAFDVLISVCGSSYTSLPQSYSTAAMQAAAYTDPVAADCQSSGNISLSAYDGQSGINILFRVTDNDGNNFYLDNISITGTTTPTPVRLLSFDAGFEGEVVKLNWNVTYETEMKGYRLLRAAEIAQNLWEEIAFVSAVNSGSGIENYFYYDLTPISVSMLYYKLVSVENSGETTESRIISLKREETGITLTAYPNPTDHSFNVTINDGKYESHVLQVYDLVGRAIEEINMPSGISAIAIGQNFSPGIYFLKLKGSEQKTIKLIKNE